MVEGVVSTSCRYRDVVRAHFFCFAGLEEVEGAVGGDDVGVAQRGGVDERARIVEQVVAN